MTRSFAGILIQMLLTLVLVVFVTAVVGWQLGLLLGFVFALTDAISLSRE